MISNLGDRPSCRSLTWARIPIDKSPCIDQSLVQPPEICMTNPKDRAGRPRTGSGHQSLILMTIPPTHQRSITALFSQLLKLIVGLALSRIPTSRNPKIPADGNDSQTFVGRGTGIVMEPLPGSLSILVALDMM